MCANIRQPVSRHTSYGALTRHLRATHPKTARVLQLAETNRRKRLGMLLPGARLKGYEELVSHLEEMAALYRRNKKLAPIAFLLDRALGDFATALEAALSGLHSVAHDAMRDVMEIEFLLRDFRLNPAHINEWLTFDDKARQNKIRPAVLRQRHAQRLGTNPQDMSEAVDYAAHSRSLHVSPHRNPFGGPGITSDDQFAADSAYWEMFEHARRLLFAIHKLRRKLAPHLKSPPGPERGLKRFRDAWERTQQMQMIFLALIQATHKVVDGKDVKPTG